jgi:hypothetical protein
MLTGDFKKLELMIARMNELGSARARVTLSRTVAAAAIRLIDEGFREGRAPTGRAWPAPKHRAGPAMRDTEALRRSFAIRSVREDGFEIRSSLSHAGALQKGAKLSRSRARRPRRRGIRRATRLVARRMVPEGQAGRWRTPLQRAAADWMRRHMGG